ncbi:hypothetical protein EI94DRAFT_1718766 [Lactarius quietus]|nr:hypothetical protein EI94DRAFT_1718766 [Lactarius quietus]
MSNSVIVTFIRHAEALLKAGEKHSPLSSLARALGIYFADTHFTAIHTSDLERAFATAAILYGHQKDPRPSFDSSELLRELDYGLAEGTRSVLNSIMDLAVRARVALEKLVLPHVWQAAKEGKTGIHVAIVSHGLCIEGRRSGSVYGQTPNAGWSRVVIDIEGLGAQEGQPMDVDKERLVLAMRHTDSDRDEHLCMHIPY